MAVFVSIVSPAAKETVYSELSCEPEGMSGRLIVPTWVSVIVTPVRSSAQRFCIFRTKDTVISPVSVVHCGFGVLVNRTQDVPGIVGVPAPTVGMG